MTATVAAALYAVLTAPAWLYSHGGFLERSVCETFIVVCVGLSFLSVVSYGGRRSLVVAAAAGLASGAAIVLKPNAGLYLPAVLLWLFLYRRDLVERHRTFARDVVTATLCAGIVPAIAILWLWDLGLLSEARTAVLDFNRFYVAQGFTLGGYLLDFSKAIWLRTKTDPVWLGGIVASLVAIADLAPTRRLPPLAGLAVCWGGAAAVVIVVNGARLFNSYFIQTFAPLSLFAAWLIADAARGSIVRGVIAVATSVLMVAQIVQRGYPDRVLGWAQADVAVLRGRADETAYLERFGGYKNNRGYSARANSELAAYVREHTRPEEEVFLFGINGAGVYFAADRLSAHRFLRANFFVATDFPDPRFQLEVVTKELMNRRPRYVIFEQLHSPSPMGRAVDSLPHHPAVTELLDAYQFEVQIEDFALYRLLE